MAEFDEAWLRRLDGAGRRAVREALVSAFPSWGRLEMLLDRVDRPLTGYAAESQPLPDAVFGVGRHALAEGWLAQLLEEASRMVPGNDRLAGLQGQQPSSGGRPAAESTTSREGTRPLPRAAASTSTPAPAGRAGGSGKASRSGKAGDPPAAPGREWDFFISYTHADERWAVWIAWQLEEADYSVYLQAWDFVPGSNWMNMMTQGIQRAERTIPVLSHAYLDSVWGKAEWQAALRRDPEGLKRRLIPVRVEDCERPELLEHVVSVDLFDLPEDETAGRLLAGVEAALGGRGKPATRPSFPSPKPGPGPASGPAV